MAHADEVYDILRDRCGASDEVRPEFYAFTQGKRPSEFRFIGTLGFGGKFWNNNGHWYVTCYREDETPERMEAIEGANTRLEVLLDGLR